MLIQDVTIYHTKMNPITSYQQSAVTIFLTNQTQVLLVQPYRR